MGKFRKLGRHAAHRVSMLRYHLASILLSRARDPHLSVCVGVMDMSVRQDDGVAAREARANRDHRRQGTYSLLSA